MGMSRILCFVALGVLLGIGIERFLAKSMSKAVIFMPESTDQTPRREVARVAAPVWSKDHPSRPRISFDQEIFEFVVGADQKQYHDFQIVNSGASALYILDVASTCGCTLVQSYDKIVAPGRQTSIKVEIDPSSFSPTALEKLILVRSNDPVHSE